MDNIVVKGARENNLKNIDITLPKNKFIVMTGVSGSGKSSLAFDTIYAEGERRYIDSLSSYARQFLGVSDKPDVDSIEGLSPAISIDQKTTNNNPRSTVGTVTEIYDYLRLLYARVGTPICPNHKSEVKSQSIEEMTNQILKLEEGTKIRVLSPVVHGEKGTHKDLILKLQREGYVRVRIDGEEYEIESVPELSKTKKHFIDVVIDRLVMKSDSRSRLYEAIEVACKLSRGKCVIDVIGGSEIVMSEQYACPLCDFSLPELEPRMFSFNAPYGSCPDCKGLGIKQKVDVDLVIPDRSKSILGGAITAINLDDPESIISTQIETVAQEFDIDLWAPVSKLDKEKLDILLYGTDRMMTFNYTSKNGNTRTSRDSFEGIITNLERRYVETKSGWIRDWISTYMTDLECPTCHGARLSDDVLCVKINNKNIYEVCCMSIKDLYDFLSNLKLSKEKESISKLILKEILDRLSFLINVGLSYLTLARDAGS